MERHQSTNKNRQLATRQTRKGKPPKIITPKASGLESDEHYEEWSIIDDDSSRSTAPQQQAQATALVATAPPSLDFRAFSMAEDPPYGYPNVCACLDCTEQGMVDWHIHSIIAKGKGKGKQFAALTRSRPEDLDSDSSEVIEDQAWTPNSPDPLEPYIPTGVDNQPSDGSWLQEGFDVLCGWCVG